MVYTTLPDLVDTYRVATCTGMYWKKNVLGNVLENTYFSWHVLEMYWDFSRLDQIFFMDSLGSPFLPYYLYFPYFLSCFHKILPCFPYFDAIYFVGFIQLFFGPPAVSRKGPINSSVSAIMLNAKLA